MGIEFPINAAAVLTIAGAAILTALLGLWLKHYLPDWRFTNLLVLALAIVLVMLAQCVVTQWRPSGEALYAAFLVALAAASLATFGYETIVNALGLAGIGKRSDKALLLQAEMTVLDSDQAAVPPPDK
jgi:multisubunit Na+/H+ antiporter MnhB subunit